MGRTVRRVALDFEWPLGKVWPGCLNPYPWEECPECGGSGYSEEWRKKAKEQHLSHHSRDMERFGISRHCPRCGGYGDVFESEEACDRFRNWTKEYPSTGEGWQMWETTSEGSPISPVFASPEELAEWLATNCPGEGTAEDWGIVIRDGYRPSLVSRG